MKTVMKPPFGTSASVVNCSCILLLVDNGETVGPHKPT